MEAVLVDVFREDCFIGFRCKSESNCSRCVFFSFKVGELLGLVCFIIILAPLMFTFCGHDSHALLYETEGIPYRKALTLSLRGLSLGKSYDETISLLESSASLVYIMYLCCTEMALGTAFVGFLFQSHFKKSWLPAKWAKARRRRIGNDGEAAETMAVSKRKGNE